MNDKALSRDDVLRELRLRKDHWQNRYGVVRIGVFGSMARGEAGGEIIRSAGHAGGCRQIPERDEQRAQEAHRSGGPLCMIAP